MYLYILLATACIYFLFITMDEKRNIRLHNPPTSLGMKLTFVFFAFIISTVLIHMFFGGNGGFSFGGGGNATNIGYISPENASIRHIVQEVEVGLPDF